MPFFLIQEHSDVKWRYQKTDSRQKKELLLQITCNLRIVCQKTYWMIKWVKNWLKAIHGKKLLLNTINTSSEPRVVEYTEYIGILNIYTGEVMLHVCSTLGGFVCWLFCLLVFLFVWLFLVFCHTFISNHR